MFKNICQIVLLKVSDILKPLSFIPMSNILSNLNPEQLEAVSATEGPMLIVAGAGTGKTRVITAKILHLILDKGVKPSEILGLTFTEKATEEMVTRIDKEMPLSYEEICIKTIHGFCDMILREKGLEIGIDPGFKLMDQTEQWIFIRKKLFEFELEYFRPLGNPNKFINTLINHFSRLKDEDITPGDYLIFAERAMESAGDDPVKKEEATKYLEAARAYSTYQKLKEKENLMDFGDLQYYALRLLEKRPSVLKSYQERFKYILVDEFQDTNFAQNKMVMMLASYHKNLTVVGDDDQSIYKWRGASLSNILDFEKSFPTCKRVVLMSNYRSCQKILDFSYSSIQNNNPLRLEFNQKISKKLVGNNGDGDAPQVIHFVNYLSEAGFVAEQIEKTNEETQCGFGNFAILVRANSLTTPFAEALKSKDIPFIIRDTQGLLRYEEIKDILALLKFLMRPQDDIAFFRLLSLPEFKHRMTDILQLQAKARDDGHSPLFFYLKKNYGERAEQTLPGVAEEDEFQKTFSFFDALFEFARKHNVNRVLGEFLDTTGYYKSLTAEDSLENQEKIQHLAQFMKLSQEFDAENPTHSIRDFLDYLESLEEAGGIIAADNVESDRDAVSILTIHSSKGLEFDYVFIPSLVAQRFPSTAKKEAFEIPRELIKENLPAEEMHLHEERRLFYVACTRARKGLYLSYSDSYEGNKKWKPSVFIEEITDQSLFKRSEISVKEGDAAQKLEERLPGKSHSEHASRLLHLPPINIETLSYSQVDTFGTCPLKYKFRYIFNIPSPSAHAANFGSSLHNAIHDFYKRIGDGLEKPSLELIKTLFEKNWIAKGYENQGHEKRRKEQGFEVIEKFYHAEELNGFKVPYKMEVPFRLKIGPFTFTGRIDRIDKHDDGTFEVVDYKTGTSRRDTNLKKDLQLSLYAMACRDVFKIPVSSLSLYFLEDTTKISTTRNDDDIALLNDELLEAAKEMQRSDFSPSPGFHCSWCEYRLLCNAAE